MGEADSHNFEEDTRHPLSLCQKHPSNFKNHKETHFAKQFPSE